MASDRKFSGRSAFHYCHHLTEVIGERVQGLENTKRTRDYIRKHFMDCGLQAVKAETFPVMASRQDSALIEADGQSFKALSFGFSGSTGPDGVRGLLVKLHPWSWNLPPDQLKKVAGKIVLLYSPSISQQVFQNLIEAGALGIIYITYHPNTPPKLPMGYVYAGISKDRVDPLPPIISVSYQDGMWLQSQATEVTIHSSVETFQSQSYNIIGEIPGSSSNDVILLSAHYDSAPYSVGAADNAAGTAIIMELTRIIGSYDWRRTLQFIACGSEECNLQGAYHYCSVHKESLTNIKLNLNYDVQGARLGNLALGVLASKRLLKPLNQHLNPWNPEIRITPTGGDNRVFAHYGIPAVHWWYGGGINFLLNHTPHDTLNNLAPSSLDLVGKASEELLIALNRQQTLTYPIPKSLQRKNDQGLTLLPR